MPYTITRHQNNVQAIDIYTRMLENRIIFLDEAINTDVASSIIAQLLFLESEDREEDIYMYINSPGGAISDGLAIIDIRLSTPRWHRRRTERRPDRSTLYFTSF